MSSEASNWHRDIKMAASVAYEYSLRVEFFETAILVVYLCQLCITSLTSSLYEVHCLHLPPPPPLLFPLLLLLLHARADEIEKTSKRAQGLVEVSSWIFTSSDRFRWSIWREEKSSTGRLGAYWPSHRRYTTRGRWSINRKLLDFEYNCTWNTDIRHPIGLDVLVVHLYQCVFLSHIHAVINIQDFSNFFDNLCD